MEISKLLTRAADDVHKVAKRTKLFDSASGSTTNESMESDDTGKYGYTVLRAISLIKEEVCLNACMHTLKCTR